MPVYASVRDDTNAQSRHSMWRALSAEAAGDGQLWWQEDARRVAKYLFQRSCSGLDEAIPVGAAIQFTIAMPGARLCLPKDMLVDCTGRVVRCSPVGNRHELAAMIDEYRFLAPVNGGGFPKGSSDGRGACRRAGTERCIPRGIPYPDSGRNRRQRAHLPRRHAEDLRRRRRYPRSGPDRDPGTNGQRGRQAHARCAPDGIRHLRKTRPKPFPACCRSLPSCASC